MKAQQIAIDGPAGAGKSTVAKAVAQKLGYLYIDTGAMYRAVAWLALLNNTAFDDEQALVKLINESNIVLEPSSDGCRVICNNTDISKEIRLPEVGNAASPISAIPGVREALVAQQQKMASDNAVVMDGRDIATVVLPQAECKIFLTASLEVRAQRRALELQQKGLNSDLNAVQRELAERDHRDSTRQHSPLRRHEDAILIDSSAMSIDQVVQKIIDAAGE